MVSEQFRDLGRALIISFQVFHKYGANDLVTA